MKKSIYIRLILMTAALASCNRPMYRQASEEQADELDSVNYCPMTMGDLPPEYYLWIYSFRPYGIYADQPYWLDRYYNAVYLRGRPVTDSLRRAGSGGTFILRNGFGKSLHTVAA